LTAGFGTCTAHLCEICSDGKPLFSFEILTVVQCPNCRSFFHKRCYNPNTCPKCQRLASRDRDRRVVTAPAKK
jgi:hypothetical protein